MTSLNGIAFNRVRFSHGRENRTNNAACIRRTLRTTVAPSGQRRRKRRSLVGAGTFDMRRYDHFATKSSGSPAQRSACEAVKRTAGVQKESNAERLRYILEEPGLRSLFREFLRSNFCEENLSFWLDVEDFKRKFNITSSAVAVTAPRPGGKNTPGQQAMERHHESLINTAFVIYHTYLAPSSQCELNIDHGLRNELSKYLEDA
ncbi:regulator of G protein signaling superfamily, partial [Hymenopellis radicata]